MRKWYNKTYLVTFIFVIINIIFHNLIFSQEINNFELLNLLEKPQMNKSQNFNNIEKSQNPFQDEEFLKKEDKV